MHRAGQASEHLSHRSFWIQLKDWDVASLSQLRHRVLNHGFDELNSSQKPNENTPMPFISTSLSLSLSASFGVVENVVLERK